VQRIELTFDFRHVYRHNRCRRQTTKFYHKDNRHLRSKNNRM